MPRIRTVKPDFWTDSKVVGLSPLARLLFIGSWNFADDYGALEPDAAQLKRRVLPDEQCDPDALVGELLDAGLILWMSNGDEEFWRVKGWEDHQRVDKRSTSRYGHPDSWNPAEPSPNPAESRRIPPSPRSGREGKGKEGKGTVASDKPPRKPRNDEHSQLFTALVEVCGLDPPLTKHEGGRVGTAAKQLVEIGASPSDVHDRAKAYRKRWPDIDLTPTGLTANWGQVVSSRNGSRPPPREDACQECGQTLDGHDRQLCEILARAS
jgi:hypothetical protein